MGVSVQKLKTGQKTQNEMSLIRDYIYLVKAGDFEAAVTLAPHINSCHDKNLAAESVNAIAGLYPTLDKQQKKQLRNELSFLPGMFNSSELKYLSISLSQTPEQKKAISTLFRKRPVQYASVGNNLFANNVVQDDTDPLNIFPKNAKKNTGTPPPLTISTWQDQVKIPNLDPNLRITQSLKYMLPDFALSTKVRQIFQGSPGYNQLAQDMYNKDMYSLTQAEHAELSKIIGEKFKDALRYQRAIEAFGSSDCVSLFEKDKIQNVCNEILQFSKPNELSDNERTMLENGDLASFITSGDKAGKKFYAALYNVPELKNSGKVYYNAWSAGLLFIPGHTFNLNSKQVGKAPQWYMNIMVLGKKEVKNEKFSLDNVADFIPETSFSNKTIMSVQTGGGYFIQADSFPFWLEGNVLINDPASNAPLGIGEVSVGAGSRSKTLGKVGDGGGAIKLGGGEYGQFEPYVGITYFNNRGSSESLSVDFQKTGGNESLTFKSKSGNSGVEFMGSVAYSSPTFLNNIMFVHVRGEFNHNTLFGKSVGAVETILAIKPAPWFNASAGGRFESSGQMNFGGDLTFELNNGLGLSISGYYLMGIVAEEGLKCQQGISNSIPSKMFNAEATVQVPLSLFFK